MIDVEVVILDEADRRCARPRGSRRTHVARIVCEQLSVLVRHALAPREDRRGGPRDVLAGLEAARCRSRSSRSGTSRRRSRSDDGGGTTPGPVREVEPRILRVPRSRASHLRRSRLPATRARLELGPRCLELPLTSRATPSSTAQPGEAPQLFVGAEDEDIDPGDHRPDRLIGNVREGSRGSSS